MKKIKIILPIVAALLAIAYFVCSLVIPGQTAWFMGQVGVVLNYPITIAGVSMTIGGIIAWILVNFILKNTKFGRKELVAMDKRIETIETNNETHKTNVNEVTKEYIGKYIELEKKCSEEKAEDAKKYDRLEKLVLTSLDTIPNKKVKAKVKEFRDEKTVNIETEEE